MYVCKCVCSSHLHSIMWKKHCSFYGPSLREKKHKYFCTFDSWRGAPFHWIQSLPLLRGVPIPIKHTGQPKTQSYTRYVEFWGLEAHSRSSCMCAICEDMKHILWRSDENNAIFIKLTRLNFMLEMVCLLNPRVCQCVCRKMRLTDSTLLTDCLETEHSQYAHAV